MRTSNSRIPRFSLISSFCFGLGLAVIPTGNAAENKAANAAEPQVPNASGTAAQPAEGVVWLDPFTVRDSGDLGYQSSSTTSATRFKVSVMDLPVAINVIPHEVLKDVGAEDIRDALKYTAAVENAGTGNVEATSQNMSYRIRGFNTPFILKNGFRFSPDGGVSMPAIESIEVVKGPSSMLYGSIPPGGVVNIITKRPQQKRAGELEFQVSSWNGYRGAVDLTGPLFSNLAYRVNAMYLNSDSFTVNTSRTAKEVIPSFEWRPFGRDGGTLFVEYTHLDRREEAVSQSPLRTREVIGGITYDRLAPRFYEKGFNIPTSWNIRPKGVFNEQRHSTFYTDYSQALNKNWALRMAGSYNDQKINLAKSQQALVVVLDKSPGPDFSTRRPIQFDRNTKPATSSGLQANLLGTYEFASAIKLNLLFGADYDKNELDELNRKSTADNTIAFFLSNPDTWNYVYPAESTFTRTTANSNLEASSSAFYTMGHVKLWGDRLSLMSGLRKTDAEATTTNRLTPASNPLNVKNGRTTYQAGAVLKIVNNVNAYAIYSESFQPQTQFIFQPKDPKTGVNAASPAMPLIGDGFDLGIKASLFGGKAIASAAYFEVNNSNIVRTLTIRDSGNVTILDTYQVQSGEEHVGGIELSLSGQVTPQWSIMANYTHLNHFVKSDASDPARVGKPLYGVFDDDFAVLTKYIFKSGKLSGLSIGAGLKYVSDGIAQPFLPNQIIEFPGYTNVDLFGSYSFGAQRQFLVKLNLRNVADKIYQVSEHLQGYPRSFQLSIFYKF